MNALAPPGLLSVGAYLRTAFHSDCEYIDGVIEERHSGEYEHSTVKAFLT